MIDVDGSVVGSYFKTFYVYYSDEQDIPGAYAPGSEVYAFEVWADVADVGAQRVVTGAIAECRRRRERAMEFISSVTLGVMGARRRRGLH